MPNYRVKLKVPNLDLDAMREKLEAMADVRLVEMKHERLAEVRELLGTGRAPGTGYEYLGKDPVARDARLMAMDPRMRARDFLGDGTITGASGEAAKSSADGAAEHAAKLVGLGGETGLGEEFTKTRPGSISSMAIESGAGVVLGAVTEVVIDRLTAAEIPGADYDKRNQTTGDTVLEVAKDLGKAAAKKGVAALPLVGTVLSTAATVQSGLRKGEFKRLKKETAGQGQAGSDATSQSLMSGMAKHNKDQMVDRIVETSTRATSDVLTGVSLGVGAAATTAVRVTGVASSVAKTAVNLSLEIGRSGAEQETRKQARMPRRPAAPDAAHEQAVDQANEALTDLTAKSGKRAKATLDYLAEGQMSVDKELYTNRQIQKDRSAEGAPDHQEHTLRPSQVAQLGRQEKARLRQRERLGADRTWDPKREKQQVEEVKEAAKQQQEQQRREQEAARAARKRADKAEQRVAEMDTKLETLGKKIGKVANSGQATPVRTEGDLRTAAVAREQRGDSKLADLVRKGDVEIAKRNRARQEAEAARLDYLTQHPQEAAKEAEEAAQKAGQKVAALDAELETIEQKLTELAGTDKESDAAPEVKNSKKFRDLMAKGKEKVAERDRARSAAHEAQRLAQDLQMPKPPAPPPMPRQAKPAARPSQGGRLKDALHIQEEKLYEKTN